MSSINFSKFVWSELSQEMRVDLLERSMWVTDPRRIWDYLQVPHIDIAFGYQGDSTIFRAFSVPYGICDYIRTPTELWAWAVTNRYEPEMPEPPKFEAKPIDDTDWITEGF